MGQLEIADHRRPCGCAYERKLYKMIEISTPDAPGPAGHYYQAMVHGDMVYVSGQLPIDAQTGGKRAGLIEEQTRELHFGFHIEVEATAAVSGQS